MNNIFKVFSLILLGFFYSITPMNLSFLKEDHKKFSKADQEYKECIKKCAETIKSKYPNWKPESERIKASTASKTFDNTSISEPEPIYG